LLLSTMVLLWGATRCVAMLGISLETSSALHPLA
jgi:hypothetical protein